MDAAQVVHRREAAAALTLGDDRLRGHVGPMPGSSSSCAAVAVLRLSFSPPGVPARGIGASRGIGVPRCAGVGLADLGYVDTLAIRDLGGEIEPVEIGVGERAAHGLDGIDHV